MDATGLSFMDQTGRRPTHLDAAGRKVGVGQSDRRELGGADGGCELVSITHHTHCSRLGG